MNRTSDSVPLGGVLVGGRSRRFGSDKATARLAGRTLAERAAGSLGEVGCDPVVLLGGGEDLSAALGLEWRPDVTAGAGPLAGIAAGLERSAELERNGLLVLACDLPLVGATLLRSVLMAVDDGIEAVVPTQRPTPGIQPLCGWYALSALSQLRGRLARGERSVRDLVAHLETRFVQVDGGAEDLLNVNTRDDLARAERLLAAAPQGARA